MSSGVFLEQNDGHLIQLEEREYPAEALLQELTANHPDLLAGDQISPNEPRRWILIRREVPITNDSETAGTWAADLLFLDQDGIPTLVEVKRSSNSQIRREVVGQMLDYAAHIQKRLPVENIRKWLEERCDAMGLDQDLEIQSLLGETEQVVRQDFWNTVQTNIDAGRIRLIFLSNQLPAELRAVIEFLNAQMSPAEVLGVEVRQYTDGTHRVFAPRVIGQSERSSEKKRIGSRRKWDPESFFVEASSNLSPTEVDGLRALCDLAGESISFGNSTKFGSFSIKRDRKVAAYLTTKGECWLYMHWLNDIQRENIRRRLDEASIRHSGDQWIRVHDWASHLDLLTELVKQIRTDMS